MCAYLRDHALDGLPSIYRGDRYTRDFGVRFDGLQPRPSSPTDGRKCGELHDQLRTYRDEIKKKDELIHRLCSVSSGTSRPMDRAYETRPVAVQVSRTEVTSLQTKINELEEKLRTKQYEVNDLKECNAMVKAQMEVQREENARLFETSKMSDTRFAELESFKKTYDGLKMRNEYAVQALQDQNRAAQEKILELEARLRAHLEVKEKSEQFQDSFERRYRNFAEQVAKLAAIDSLDDLPAVNLKVKEAFQEHEVLKTQVTTLTDTIGVKDSEIAACKETITRLMGQKGDCQIGYTSYSSVKVSYKAEVERMHAQKADLEAQILLYEKRLESSQNLLKTMREELAEKSTQLAALDADHKDKSYSAVASEKQFQALLESLAAITGSAACPVAATESEVKDRVKKIVFELRDQLAMAESVDQRVQALQRQFETQYVNTKDMMEKTRIAETERTELLEKIKLLESELGAKDLLRDGLHSDKDRICRQLQKLADALRLSYMPEDFDDAEYIISKLISHTDQTRTGCCGCGGGGLPAGGNWSPRATGGSRTVSRQVQALKDQLEAKDNYVDLLKRRLAQSEETVKREREAALKVVTEPRSARLTGSETQRERVTRLETQLDESREEIIQLRHALLESRDMKDCSYDDEQEVDQLNKTLEKLEEVRQKQARKIARLKKVADNRSVQDSSVHAMSMELRQARAALADLRRKEKHLRQLRLVLGQCVGVNAEAGPQAETEIVSRVMQLAQGSPYSSGPQFQASMPPNMAPNMAPNMPPNMPPNMASNMRGHPNQPMLMPGPPQSAGPPSYPFQGKTPVPHQSGGPPRGRTQQRSQVRPQSIMKSRARSMSPVKVDERQY